jgi:hypothetical protein
LEIMTLPEPAFDDYAILGALPLLERLAAIVEAKLAMALVGEAVCIRMSLPRTLLTHLS